MAPSGRHHLAWHHLALRLDTPNEVDYCRHGGILQFVLRQMTA